VTVLHNPALLPLLADRVIALKAGRIAFDLPVAQVEPADLAALYRQSPEPTPASMHA
jgi:phosphonate transport system ATP-binding protein